MKPINQSTNPGNYCAAAFLAFGLRLEAALPFFLPALCLRCRGTRASSTACSSPAHQRSGLSFRPTSDSPAQPRLLRLLSSCRLCRAFITWRSGVPARAFQSVSAKPRPRLYGQTWTHTAQSELR